MVDDFFDGPDSDEAKKIGAMDVGVSAKAASGTSMSASVTAKQDARRIAVHCVAGLGRAPFLVALALVHKGAAPLNTINLIRNNRKGALNPIQANYIQNLKPGKVIKG